MFKGTRTHLRTLLAMTFGLLALSSCRNKEINVDVFKASLEVMTKTVYEGEDFEFRVFSNKSFKIESLSMASDPSLVKSIFPAYAPNSVYTIDEKGYQDFIIKEVHIASSHRGTLSMVVSDPETGKKYELTDYYTFYSAANAKLVINNLPASGESVDLNMTVPLVVDGDDFSFSISLKTPSATLKDFDCEFNDGQLKKGMDLDFSDGLPRTFTFPAVSVQEDGYAAPNTLSLTLVDNETGEESTVTANYLKITEFKPEVSLQPSSFRTGESPVVKISSNRNSFKLLEYIGPEWFSVTNGLSQNVEIQLTDVGYATYTVSPVETSASESGTIKFFFKDNHFTLREKEVDVTYSVQAPVVPENVSLSATSFRIKTDETVSVTVSTSTPNSTQRFIAKIVSGEKTAIGLYGPLSSENISDVNSSSFSSECTITSGKLLICGRTGGYGDVTVRVCPEGKPSAYKDIKIYVKRDVALRIKGEFKNYLSWDPSKEIDAIFSYLGEPVGWWGVPYSLEAELVTWENRSGTEITSLPKEDVSTYLRCYSISSQAYTRLVPTFTLSVGNRVTSNFFYGAYKDYSDPRSRLLTGKDISRVIEKTLPSSLNTIITEDGSKGYSFKVRCSKLLILLQDLNCNANYQNGYGLFVMLREAHHSEDYLRFGSFDISVQNIVYDSERYTVRYIFNFTEIPGEWGEVEPWWAKIDGSRPWIIPYNG